MKKLLSCILVVALTTVTFAFSGCSAKRSKVTFSLSNDKQISFVLYNDYAPETVAHFIELCESGYYNNTILSDYKTSAIYAGNYEYDFTSNIFVEKSAVNTVKGEFSKNGVIVQNNPLKHVLGTLGFYNERGNSGNGSYNSGSNVFFIDLSTNTTMDGYYCAFGKYADEASLAVIKELSEITTVYNEDIEQYVPDELSNYIYIKSVSVKK